MKKLLLLVTLFLGGCSINSLDTFYGKTGMYSIKTESTGEILFCRFTISEDGTTFTLDGTFELALLEEGHNYAIYGGWINETTYYTVYLYDLTSYGGRYDLQINDTIYMEVGFSWVDSGIQDIIAGKTGVFIVSGVAYTFTISDDAFAYMDGTDGYEINISNLSSNWVSYRGIVNSEEILIVLHEITSMGGKYNRYVDGVEIIDVGFSWDITK